MYTVSLKRDFIGQHYLVGGDWGPENRLNSHHYEVEVQLEGSNLDQHGFLVDIVDIERNLGELIARYKDKTLNDFPEFEGLNPSIEHFSRILCEALSDRIKTSNLGAITVLVWEDSLASASFRKKLGCESA